MASFRRHIRWPFHERYSDEAIREAEEIDRRLKSGYYSSDNPESPYYGCAASGNRKPSDRDYGQTKYRLVETPKYLRGRRRMYERGGNLSVLDSIITLLLIGERPPKNFRPHKLDGRFKGMWECHIKGANLGDDWVLIYRYGESPTEGGVELVLIAVNTGTHKECLNPHS